ncbi:LacI family transcriptional regulator [Stakelama sp. CBK3Z-3]|uniref:LacI family transcriptional regulator n=1 Tax=Stakelama flava TaxID=2860338 RepID=A0ABS6XRL6_9SPHN|nr:LacI family DNA-binding transcriptional regulator [Stakelama flava]MBW4332070.1 LacI family transcriptional regulator [Stakelama flava]
MASATIRDVAREAQVSVASVSRVLNGSDNVRPEMRERVEAASRRLGYTPHAGARSLSLSRAHAIGVMLPDLHGEFFSEFVRGMDREAAKAGLQLLLSNMHADAGQAVEALKTMRGRVDGLIVMAPDIDPALLFSHLPQSLPAILVSSDCEGSAHPQIQVDNMGAAEVIVDHLVASGYRNIVHISGPAGNREAVAREHGYREAVRRHGLSPRVIQGDFSEEAGTAAASEILRNRDGADAVFAANDMMAVGALVVFRDAGVAVGGEMGLAGFDDVPLARLISPSLTTMRVDIAGIGARALTMIAAIVNGDTAPDSEPLRPELIIRQTTKAGK